MTNEDNSCIINSASHFRTENEYINSIQTFKTFLKKGLH